jgi:hypothetical protein
MNTTSYSLQHRIIKIIRYFLFYRIILNLLPSISSTLQNNNKNNIIPSTIQWLHISDYSTISTINSDNNLIIMRYSLLPIFNTSLNLRDYHTISSNIISSSQLITIPTTENYKIYTYKCSMSTLFHKWKKIIALAYWQTRQWHERCYHVALPVWICADQHNVRFS